MKENAGVLCDSNAIMTQSLISLQQLHTSLLNTGLSNKERIKILCRKPTYQMRRVKNKGAVIVLTWNFLVSSAIFYITNTSKGLKTIEFKLKLVARALTLLFAGWLADIYFGRYKVICLSIWITWIGFMLATANSVVAALLDTYSSMSNYIYSVLMIIVMIGLGGFQDIIQFGVDQLYDASSSEITSFIVWYVWTISTSGCMLEVIIGVIPEMYLTTEMLLLCVFLSIALCSMFFFNHLLVKEPVTQNPFKLIYSVIKYAIKNSRPRCRSAFTYCEDELPSRIDLGKSKYGGPFTTEQVEDVKTVLHLLAFMSLGSVLLGGEFASYLLFDKVWSLLNDANPANLTPLQKHYFKNVTLKTVTYSGTIVIPLYQFFIHPVYYWCVSIFQSWQKLTLGFLLLIASILSSMVLDIVIRHSNVENSTCINTIIQSFSHTTSLDYRWITIPLLLQAMSIILLAIGAIEFVVSQTPYSMKGFIMGTTYGMICVCASLGLAISIPFSEKLPIWSTGVISSGFWHELLLLVIEIIAGILLVFIGKKCKKRKREDVLPNEHIFAERYYDRDC